MLSILLSRLLKGINYMGHSNICKFLHVQDVLVSDCRRNCMCEPIMLGTHCALWVISALIVSTRSCVSFDDLRLQLL